MRVPTAARRLAPCLGLACLTTIVLGAGAPRTARHAPLPRDTALVMGTLPDGMRFYLRPNHTPAHRAELRLVVDAGSALEDDDQQGFAHFLEHMAFNGTTHFPHNSLIDFVETSGMSFGADLNAYTSFDETVYTLTVPTDDPAILDRGLTVLQDWASGGITLDSAEVVAERGVVLGEWRTRLLDSASQVIRDHYDSLLLGDSRYRHRSPIGLPKLVRAATASPIARFYHDWYRPDLMAVVVVGDFDAGAMERQIRTRFGAIPEPRSPRRRPTPHLDRPRGPVVDVYRGDVSPHVDLLWPVAEPPADPTEAYRAEIVDRFLTQALERKLLRIRQQTSRPFLTAVPQRGSYVRPAPYAGVAIVAWPDSIERALATVATEMARLAQHGVTETALDEQKAALIRELDAAVLSAPAHPSRAYADDYVHHFLTGEGLLASPAQTLALANRILPTITPQVIADAAKRWRDRDGMRVLVDFPRFAHVAPPTRERILAILDSVAQARVGPDRPLAVDYGPLMGELPTPGRIVSEVEHPRSGVTEWTLSNGARVLFKPTFNDPDQLLIRAWSPGGFSLLPDSLFFSSGRMVGPLMTEAAGLGDRSHRELLHQLSFTGIRDFKVHIGYADESIDLAGTPFDMTTLFQMLYLQFTAPRLDSAAIASWQSIAKYQPRGFSFDDQLNQIFARGDPRMLPVQTFLADLVRIPDALAVYHDRFGDASDFTFTIVGAASAPQVKAFVERYIASLPGSGRATREQPAVPDVAPFHGRDRMNLPVENVPRSDVLLVFDGEFPTEPAAYLRERERLGVVTGVLNKRLRERLREQLGGTYSPQVVARTYLLPPEHYRILVNFNAAPERANELDREMFGILDSLRAVGASAAELANRSLIQRRRLETELQDDHYWLETLALYDRLGIPFDRIVSPFPDSVVTSDDFRAAAKRYMPSDVFIHMMAVPRDSTIATRAEYQ